MLFTLSSCFFILTFCSSFGQDEEGHLGRKKIAPAYERLFVPFCQLGSSIRINALRWAENLLVTPISFVFTKETVASHLFKMIQRISLSVPYSNCDTYEISSRKPTQQM